ncbi:hypothetical protein [Streptococcus gordonii]|uniref:hypothetical protein n=1 Tax=Streptococcus gordonii TaxID=1302 RepID=UPI001CBAE532|nr:hypothetical protein [Streptococcus gordonii]MBZ2133139.1 hypothetical protein [Streptococcus gordonii]MBZ2142746.1 hypothetical protein [Streptococcus gordonii]MBZ2143501.1 hypothetical protein [Streptococcus gordonii]MBZ2145053.1 hypothetical protein [Streptococcus gordonii]
MKNKKSLILILASLSFLSIAFYFFMIPRDSLQKGPMYELLEKKGFVYVESRYHSVRGIDFKNKEAFENDQYLIKNGKLYDGVGEKDAKDRFDHLLLDEFSFILSHPKLTSDQIFIESYKITLSADEVINKDLLKERHIPKLERLYSIYQDSFKKVRISFNKENLPTKVELYYEGENGLAWYTWRTYSYPYKNEADFKEDLDSVYKIYKDQQKIEADKKKSKK